MAARLTNIAPLITLLFLVAIFSFLAPSFATLDNLGNILRQAGVTSAGEIAASGSFNRVRASTPACSRIG